MVKLGYSKYVVRAVLQNIRGLQHEYWMLSINVTSGNDSNNQSNSLVGLLRLLDIIGGSLINLLFPSSIDPQPCKAVPLFATSDDTSMTYIYACWPTTSDIK